ncbi:type II secretion system F family protein [Granulicoccus phenolivorans]|uniref:type II secretion system F family protein n=1 Tax=Granulicoccus phenolivorans TaxID=266854 RepID=UPI0006863466|nr:hypothetical protein [Granulicoccus phenolivorans]
MILAMGCAALAGWLLFGAPLPGTRRITPRVEPKRSARPVGPAVAAVGTLVVATYLAGGPGTLAPVVALGLVTATVVKLIRDRNRARRAMRDKREVSYACSVLAGELRLGKVPESALAAAAQECPVLAPAAALVRIGGDPVARWLEQAAEPGLGGLQSLARAWQVSTRTGAPMGETLATVADTLRTDHEVDLVVSGELAAPRMTGRLLAGLPLAGIGLGYTLGGDPIGFLTGSLPGQLGLVVGIGLTCLGVLWTERLANKVAAR